jgi:hypothetical protein
VTHPSLDAGPDGPLCLNLAQANSSGDRVQQRFHFAALQQLCLNELSEIESGFVEAAVPSALD